MSRVKWEKTKPRLRYTFIEWPENWPAKFSPEQLSLLQATTERDTCPSYRVWKAEIKAWQNAIDAAVEAGEIPHVIEIFGFRPNWSVTSPYASPEEQKQARLNACRQEELPAISAADFAAWLAAQGETSSVHITAWFKAVGASTQPQAPGAHELALPVDTAPVQNTAKPSPGEELDYSLLATPAELLDAFGKWGMGVAWFDDLNSRKWLLDARRKKGQGQRGHVIEPLFCPFAVMKGLIGSVRRANRLQPDTAWRTLAHKFPKVYAEFSEYDPRELTGD